MLCVLVLLSLLIGAFGYQGSIIYKRRQLESQTWDHLVGKLVTVQTARLLKISEVYLHPGAKQLRIEPWQMWEAVGGIAGIGRLLANANAMLDLARYAERWNDENGRVISEMMRRDATRVKRAVLRVQCAWILQHGMLRSPFHLQEAISSYCLMRGRLLGMYADAHEGLLPRLAEAL